MYSSKKNQGFSDVIRVLRTDTKFAVLEAIPIAIKGTRLSRYQKKTGEDDDVDYKVVACNCEDGKNRSVIYHNKLFF